MTDKKSPLLAILLACGGYALFNVSDVIVKHLAIKYHFTQVMMMNAVFSVFFLCLGTLYFQGKKAFYMKRPWGVMGRAVLGTAVSLLNILAFPHIPLARFYTIIFTSPFWVAILSAILLKEKLEPKRIAIIIAGFAVILYIFRPGSGLGDIWALAAAGSAFFYACSIVLMRHLGPGESRAMIVMASPALSGVLVLPFISQYYMPMPAVDLALFAVMGLIGAVSVSMIVHAFQHAPSAAAIAPYHYTQIFWGAALGYVVFGEVPQDRTVVGAAFIILAGLTLIYGEAKASRALKKQAEEIAKAEMGAAR